MEKMTKKAMYTFIADALADNEQVVTFCANEIALLDKKAAKAKAKAAEKKAATDVLSDAVYATLSDTDFEPIADIVARIDGEDVTTAKVTYRLSQLVKAGKAEKAELTIEATENSKARKCVGYRKVNA